MIVVDANLILYAEDSLSQHHKRARDWWDKQLSGTEPVGLCWPVLTAFLRIATNPRLHQRPLSLDEACEKVESWIAQPCVHVIQPTTQHWAVLRELMKKAHATSNLVSDAHVAAIAVEHDATLYSSDRDFARFKGVKWINPLED